MPEGDRGLSIDQRQQETNKREKILKCSQALVF